ncbi:MAG TPA: DUF1295 domain-containing protein [Kofleriaceae bacterium]|nr:DUF1295 domain-containing protein [Kofleriaceae bacterium]
MVHAIGVRILEAWLLCAVLQGALWLIAQRTKNAGIVDVGWAATFTGTVVVFAVQPLTPRGDWLPIAIIVVAWSVRLSGYLVSRGAATGPEEGRYVELRRRWADRASRRFFVFFQAQAALTAVLSSAFVVPFVATPWDGGAVRIAGAALSVIGVIGETVADAQLARFRRKANQGTVCDVGLWAYSRHPNYFFEWCVWVGYAAYGIAFWPYGAIALIPQALLLGSILFVTGIPPTEAQSIRSRSDAYRAYQQRVSKFVPLPPKRSQPTS